MLSNETEQKVVKAFLDDYPDIKDLIVYNDWELVFQIWWGRAANLGRAVKAALSKTLIDANIPFLNYIKTLGKGIFNDGIFNMDLILPSNIKKIDNWAFSHSTFKSIKLPNDLEYINWQSFCETVIVDDNPLYIPASVKKIDEFAFYCSFVKEIIFDKNFTGQVDIGAFQNSKLEKIDLGSISELPDHCFQGCKQLKEINIPDNCTVINSYCFADCAKLEKIRLPKDIHIVSFAFYGCQNLKDITYDGDKAQFSKMLDQRKRNGLKDLKDTLLVDDTIIVHCNDGLINMTKTGYKVL